MTWQGNPSHHRAKGFTLIALLLTLALLATLSTVAYPLTALMGQHIRELDLQRSLREIRCAIDAYKTLTTP
ncbi:prepilin-type N-terminal cleavage/methylation domain-containing protein [Pseudomonas salmasensis]|uniref:Prepilin-type N-terminal cleavage/methylation domain-containing protein n=1 Tax=Pseudomonas salmasensis TaxID=2745514 RepID=A0ABU5FNE8_9PSED|nr:prepilin-type N-terminal cleavage/methylation domain-containing protein [Pseudomonas salmasensis]MDY4303577.1 prepilin-type N-terminal cleavage/methylation domain-containing protein [Pseudomonas salmasensis]